MTALKNLIDDTNIAIPATVQVPINVAATICDVEVNAIASSNDKGDKSCTAKSASQPLADAIVSRLSDYRSSPMSTRKRGPHMRASFFYRSAGCYLSAHYRDGRQVLSSCLTAIHSCSDWLQQ